MTTRIDESKSLVNNISYGDGKKSKSTQKWNKYKCRYERKQKKNKK